MCPRCDPGCQRCPYSGVLEARGRARRAGSIVPRLVATMIVCWVSRKRITVLRGDVTAFSSGRPGATLLRTRGEAA